MTKKVYGRQTPAPERLRLLEAVAEVARADALRRRDDMGYEAMTLGECAAVFPINSGWKAVLEALATLEAYGGKEQP